MMSAIEEAFEFRGDHILNLSTENESMRSKIGCTDIKRLEESKTKLLKQFDDDKVANLIMSRMQNR